jgi:hypothetical protein
MSHGNDSNGSDNSLTLHGFAPGAEGLKHFASDVWRKPARIKAEEKKIDKVIEARTDLSERQKATLESEIHLALERNIMPGGDVPSAVPAKDRLAAAEKLMAAGVSEAKAAKVATAERKLDKVARDNGLSPKDTTTLIEMQHAILDGNRSGLDRLMHTTPLSDLKVVLPALSANMKAAGLTIKFKAEGQWTVEETMTMNPYASLMIYPPYGDSYVTFSNPRLGSGIDNGFVHTLEQSDRAFKSIGEMAVDKLSQGDKHKK